MGVQTKMIPHSPLRLQGVGRKVKIGANCAVAAPMTRWCWQKQDCPISRHHHPEESLPHGLPDLRLLRCHRVATLLLGHKVSCTRNIFFAFHFGMVTLERLHVPRFAYDLVRLVFLFFPSPPPPPQQKKVTIFILL